MGKKERVWAKAIGRTYCYICRLTVTPGKPCICAEVKKKVDDRQWELTLPDNGLDALLKPIKFRVSRP